MTEEELEAILTEIKEFYENDLQNKNSENDYCIVKNSDKIQEILDKDLFEPCDAIQVFLLFNCKVEDRFELILGLKIVKEKEDKWIRNLLTIAREKDEKKKELKDKLLEQIKKELDTLVVQSTVAETSITKFLVEHAQNKPKTNQSI